MKTHAVWPRRGGMSVVTQMFRAILALFAGGAFLRVLAPGGGWQPGRPEEADQPATPKRPTKPTISVIMPALNEADSVGWVVENLPGWVDELVLVDGQSIDYTVSVVRSLEPGTVVVHQTDMGKGSALRAGFAVATSDIIVTLDADGSTDPREIPLFVDALRNGADFAKGSRHMVGGGSRDFTRVRRFGNRMFVALSNLLYGHQFTDLLYGYVAFWRSDLAALNLTATGFEIETQLVLNAAKAGMRIFEVPSVELPRRAGVSNLNAWKDGLRVLRTMLKEHPVLGSSEIEAADVALIRVQTADAALIPVQTPAPWLPAQLHLPSELDAREKRGGEQASLPEPVAA